MSAARGHLPWQESPEWPPVLGRSPVLERPPVLEQPPALERLPVLERPPVLEQPPTLEREIPAPLLLDLPPHSLARDAIARPNTLEAVTQHLRAAVTTAAELADLDPAVVLLIQESVARQHCVLAMHCTPRTIRVAIAAPLDV